MEHPRTRDAKINPKIKIKIKNLEQNAQEHASASQILTSLSLATRLLFITLLGNQLKWWSLIDVEQNKESQTLRSLNNDTGIECSHHPNHRFHS